MQVLLVCGISGISATKLLASRWTRWSCRSFLSKHDVSDEFCMWLHSSPCSVLVCIAAAPRRWCGGNWLRKGSWSTQHTHRRLQIPWAGLASDRQRHPAGSSPALVGIRLSRHMLLASSQTLVALYSRCHETQAVKGKVQTTSIWIEMQTFPSWTGSRWVRKRGAGQWPGWWCPKPLLPLGRETKWLTGFACGPSVLERRRRRWAGRSWCTVRLWSAEDPSYSLIPSCSSLAQYPIPLAAPLHLVLACRQKRGAEGAWGWEEQQSGRVRSSPVVCHKQWWQGKFALQRCLVCPGSTTFLEKANMDLAQHLLDEGSNGQPQWRAGGQLFALWAKSDLWGPIWWSQGIQGRDGCTTAGPWGSKPITDRPCAVVVVPIWAAKTSFVTMRLTAFVEPVRHGWPHFKHRASAAAMLTVSCKTCLHHAVGVYFLFRKKWAVWLSKGRVEKAIAS